MFIMNKRQVKVGLLLMEVKDDNVEIQPNFPNPIHHLYFGYGNERNSFKVGKLSLANFVLEIKLHALQIIRCYNGIVNS